MSGLPNGYGYGYGYGGGQNLHSQLGNYFNQGSSSDSAGLDADNSLALYLAGSAGLTGSAGANSATDSYPSYGAAAALQASAAASDPYGGQSGHSFDFPSTTTQQQQEALQAADAELYYRQQLQQENLEQQHLELQHLRRQQELHRGYGQHVDAASSLASMWAGGSGNNTSNGQPQGAGTTASPPPTGPSSTEDLYADLFKRQIQQQQQEQERIQSQLDRQSLDHEQEQLKRKQLQQQLQEDKKFELQKHEPMMLEEQDQHQGLEQQFLELQKTKRKNQQIPQKKDTEEVIQSSEKPKTPTVPKRGRGRPRKDKTVTVKKKDTKEDTDAVAAFMAELAAPKKETVPIEDEQKELTSKKVAARELSMTPGAIRARARRAKVKEEKEKNENVVSKDLLSRKNTQEAPLPSIKKPQKEPKTEPRVAISSPLSNISAPKPIQPSLSMDPPKRILPKIHFLSRLASLKGIDVSGPHSVKVNATIKPKITPKVTEGTLPPRQSDNLLSQSNGNSKRNFLQKKTTPHEFLKSSNPPGVLTLQGKDCLIASTLPPNFPPKLTYRALAAYSLIRSLSATLRLAPFTPNVFIRGLALPCQNKLIGTIHVHLLRFLFAQYNLGVYHHRGDGAPKRTAAADSVKDAAADQFLARKSSPVKFERCGVENITYLDCQTWPLYYEDFVHIMLSSFVKSQSVKDVLLDGRSVAMRDLDTGELEGSKMDEYFKSQPSELEDELNRQKMEEAEKKYRDQTPQVPQYSGHQSMKAMGNYNAPMYGNTQPSSFFSPHDQYSYNYYPPTAYPPLLPKTNKGKDEVSSKANATPKQPLIQGEERPAKNPEKSAQKTVTTDKAKVNSIVIERKNIPDNEETTEDEDFSTEEEVDSDSDNLGMTSKKRSKLVKQLPKQNEISKKVAIAPTPAPAPAPVPAPKRPRGRPRKIKIDNLPRSTKIESKHEVSVSDKNLDNNLKKKKKDDSKIANLVKSKKNGTTSKGRTVTSNSKKLSVLGKEKDNNSLKPTVITKLKEETKKKSPLVSNTGTEAKRNAVQNNHEFMEKGENRKSSRSPNSKTMTVEPLEAAERNCENGDNVKGSHDQNNSTDSYKKESDQLKETKPMEPSKQQKLKDMKKSKQFLSPPLPGGVIKSSGTIQKQKNGKRALSHPPPNNTYNQQHNVLNPNFPLQSTVVFPPYANYQQHYFPPLPPQYFASNMGPYGQYSSGPRRPAYQLPTNFSSSFNSGGFNMSAPSYNMPPLKEVVRVRAVTCVVDEKISEYIVGKNSQDNLGPLYPSVLAFLEKKALDTYNGISDERKDSEKPTKSVEEISSASKKITRPVFIKTQEKAQSTKDRSACSETRWNKDDLPQMNPIKYLRKGRPYHLLPISMKISILEYLLDEILSLDVISKELSLNQLRNEHLPTPYGALPNPKQLENLTNSDYCSVCSLEGDLLCCDGCTGSYHRRCINIPVGKELPEGKWLCPECQVVEPSKMGPLHGGSKACVDWFVIDDIAGTHTQDSNTDSVGGNLDVSHVSMNEPMYSHGAIDRTTFKGSNQINSTTGEYINSRANELDCSRTLKNVEFKVIHGFVFMRDRITKRTMNPLLLKDKNLTPEKIIHGPTTFEIEQEVPLPLNQDQLLGLIQILGPDICSRWPFCQIPFDPKKVWIHLQDLDVSASNQSTKTTKMLKVKNEIDLIAKNNMDTVDNTNQTKSDSLSAGLPYEEAVSVKCSQEEIKLAALQSMRTAYVKYFEKNDSFNPLIYINNYQRAPFHPSIRAHVGPHFFSLDQTLFDIERFPFRYSMSRDTSRDNNLSLVLRTHESIYDPLKSVREYMLRLEKLLVRSSLINELWGLRNKQLDQNVWSRSVANCRSVKSLAILLVGLIDEVHPRAFFEEWTKLPGHSSGSGSNRGETRVYFDIGIDFDTAKAIKKRKWDRSSGCDILRLLVSESGGMSEFFNVKDARMPVQESRSKRKVAAVGRIDGVVGDKMAAVIALGKKPSNKEQKKTESGNTSEIAKSVKKGDKDATQSAPNLSPPKRSMTAYMLFLKEKHDEARNNRQEGKIDKFTKKISEMWKSLSPTERAPYLKAARKDKERYLAEKAALKKRKSLEMDTKEGRSSTSDSKGRRRIREDSSRRRLEKGQTRNALHDALDILVIGKNKVTEGKKDLSAVSNSIDEASEKRTKVLRLEQILKEPYEREMHWPLAGRKLFEPEGSLTQRVTKWLGRNAGMKMAPYVTYTTKYEVGLPSVCYMWRKRTLSCVSLEQLILQVRFLESFINKPTINSCETLSRRSLTAKCLIQKEIKCSHVDPATGMIECLVVNKAKNRGCWMSEESVDQSALILHRYTRLEEKKAIFKQALVNKTKEEAEEARKKKLEADKKRADEARKKTEALLSKKAQLGKKRQKIKEVKVEQKEETSSEKRHKMAFQKAFERHQFETKRLLKESAARGLPSVPPEVMNPIRMKHMAEMKESNDSLRRVSNKGLQDGELTGKLQQAESAGIEMYIKEAKQAAKDKSKQNAKKDGKKSSERDVSTVSSATKGNKKRKKEDVKGPSPEQPNAKVKGKVTEKKTPSNINQSPKIELNQKNQEDSKGLIPSSTKPLKRNLKASLSTSQEMSSSVAKKDSNKRKLVNTGKPGLEKRARDMSSIEDLSEAIEDGTNTLFSTLEGSSKFKSNTKGGLTSITDSIYNGSYNREDQGLPIQTTFPTDQSNRFNDFAESSGFHSTQPQHSAQSYSFRDKFGDKFNYEDASHQMLKERQQQSLHSQLGSALGSLTGSLGFGGGFSENHMERLAQSTDYGQSSYRSPMVDNSTNNVYGSSADQQHALLQNMLSTGLQDSIVGEGGQGQKCRTSAQNPYYLSDRYDALSNTASLNADAQLYLQSRPSPLDVAQTSLLSLGGAGSLDHQQFSQNFSAAQNLLSGGTYDNHQQFGASAFSRQATDSIGFGSNSSAAFNPGSNRMNSAVSGYGDILEPNPINDVVGDGLYNTGMTGGSSNNTNLQTQLLQSHLMSQHQNNQGNSSSSYFDNYQHF